MHGLGHLPSTIIKKGTDKIKKAAANKKKVADNAKKVEANRKKVAENKAKVRLNKADVELAKFYKKVPKGQSYLKSGGGVKKAQTGQSMDRGTYDSNSGMERPSPTNAQMKRGGIKKMQPGGPTDMQLMRRNLLTKRANRLENKGDKNRDSGNTEKAWKMYDRADAILAKRSAVREKAGYKEGGSTDKKWIQKAINPKHKGYCTPMSKPTCTPKRKALAKTLKAMAKNR
jgi:hypothetical protein